MFGARDEAAKRAYAMLMEVCEICGSRWAVDPNYSNDHLLHTQRIVGPTVSKATSGGQALSSSSSKPVTHEKKSSAAAAATQGPDERVVSRFRGRNTAVNKWFGNVDLAQWRLMQVDSKDEPEDEDDEEEDDDKEDHWRR